VVCLLGAVQRATELHAARHPVSTPQPETHAATNCITHNDVFLLIISTKA